MIPQVEEITGLSKSQITLTPEGLNVLIKSYCRESGVRSLRKQIEKIYRKVAFKVNVVNEILSMKILMICNRLCMIRKVVSILVKRI